VFDFVGLAVLGFLIAVGVEYKSARARPLGVCSRDADRAVASRWSQSGFADGRALAARGVFWEGGQQMDEGGLTRLPWFRKYQ